MIDEQFREQLNALGDGFGLFQHYILVGREPLRVAFFEWLNAACERGAMTVKLWSTEIGGVSVSTIFLGVDHGFRTPILFETMIFGGPLDCERHSYATYDEAEAGHEAAVQAVRSL
jgi:hypothetical protein